MKMFAVSLLLLAGLIGGNEAILCHFCEDCDLPRNIIDCSIISESEYCYMVKSPTSEVFRSCGSPLLDGLVTVEGCSVLGGHTICKCSGDECNAYPPDVKTTSTTVECYNCEDCETGLGTVLDCSIMSKSTFCYATVHQTTGKVTRSCGVDMLDKFLSTEGCSAVGDNVICKCSGNRCNDMDAASTVITTTSTVECYVCDDCEDDGKVSDCSIVSDSKTCYLILNPSGKVRKSCGMPSMDEETPEDGCVDMLGYTVCRCSGSRCNKDVETARNWRHHSEL